MNAEAYPLQWPAGWTRTPAHLRERSRYRVTQARSQDDLLHSLRLLGARYVTISTNVELRRDGLPYSNRRPPTDPGVAVYWERNGKPEVIACDSWATVGENIRAIGQAVDALRQLERCGASEILNRAFTGFSALPAASGATGPRTWREVLGLDGAGPRTVEQVEAAYRRLARERHPDAGGSHEAMLELNAAREDALREVGRG